MSRGFQTESSELIVILLHYIKQHINIHLTKQYCGYYAQNVMDLTIESVESEEAINLKAPKSLFFGREKRAS